MKVFTITLNPAFDVHIDMEKLQTYKENYSSSHIKCAGGKGINISRALNNFGIENECIFVAGCENEAEFSLLLDNEKINYKKIITKGRIRENITIHDSLGETRISAKGTAEDVIKDVFDILLPYKEKIVTFTGKIPEGIEKEKVIEFLIKINDEKTKLVVDSNSFLIEDLKRIKPFLIKPNEEEIIKLTGRKVEKIQDAKNLAKELSSDTAENVIISLGKDGFLYSAKENGTYFVTPPKISPVSTIGAGDSLIAGYIAGIVEGKSIEKILSLAASFGTSACLTKGTTPPDKKTIEKIEKEVITEKL